MRVKPRGCSVPRGWALAGACALGGGTGGSVPPCTQITPKTICSVPGVMDLG